MEVVVLLLVLTVAVGVAVAWRQRPVALPEEEEEAPPASNPPPSVPAPDPKPEPRSLVVTQTHGRPKPRPPERPPATWVRGQFVLPDTDIEACIAAMPRLPRLETTPRHLEVHLLLEQRSDGSVCMHLCDGLPMAEAFRLLVALGGSGGQARLQAPRDAVAWLDDGPHLHLGTTWAVDIDGGALTEVDATPPAPLPDAEVVRREAYWYTVDTRATWPDSPLRQHLAAVPAPRVWDPTPMDEVLWAPEDHGSPPLAEIEAYYEGRVAYAVTDELTSWYLRQPDGTWIYADREGYLRRHPHFTSLALDRLRWALELGDFDDEQLIDIATQLQLPRPAACLEAMLAPSTPGESFDVGSRLLEQKVEAWYRKDHG